MTQERRPLAQPMAWWGAVQSSVRARATTAELWTAIRDFGTEHGLAYPPGMFREVNRLRSLATGLRTSSERLAKAPVTDALTGAMIGRLPYARSAFAQGMLREFHARVKWQAVSVRGRTEGYITLGYTGPLPATVGDLYADAAAVIETQANRYAAELVGELTIELGEW